MSRNDASDKLVDLHETGARETTRPRSRVVGMLGRGGIVRIALFDAFIARDAIEANNGSHVRQIYVARVPT